MTVRFGVLGAAKIVKGGLLDPAAGLDDVEVVALAARDRSRAEEYAAENGIPRVLDSYEAVVEDPEVTAVYVPTPAALHGYWTRRAIEAGKHVLCEKPFTANADEAAGIADRADGSGLVVMEAMHSRFSPRWERMAGILRSGVLGDVTTAEATFVTPHADRAGDIRWQLPLGGGALMDLGVYPVTLLRHLFGEPEVRSATAQDEAGVDAAMTAELAFAGGVEGRVVASMAEGADWGADLRVTGTAGTLAVRMPYHPYLYGELVLTTPDGTETEGPEERTTYSYMVEAFRDSVLSGAPVVTGAREATATMRVLDAVYRAAGMEPRQPLPVS
ncbi:Gfo/Idh/MocA family protein [Blastococcus sp. URHD0036]|uniref:Gfo/Idh/MocA family protein n=1 Tax=Blastococcus sp. URHD0036 TaxID=1380356 RepID=UPI0004961C7F|nr:Gfo/Idh/MocA family oxidoreductase [Blastococcus sp. URHD0036]